MCVCPQRSAGSEDHECVCVCVCVCAHLYMRALSQKAQSLPLEKGTGSGGRVLGEGGERCWRGRSFGLLGRSLVSKKNEIWGTRNLEKRLNTRLSRMFPKAEGEGSCRGQACFWKQFIPQKKGIKRALASHVPLPSFLSSLLSPLDVPLPLAPLPPSLPAFPPSCRGCAVVRAGCAVGPKQLLLPEAPAPGYSCMESHRNPKNHPQRSTGSL